MFSRHRGALNLNSAFPLDSGIIVHVTGSCSKYYKNNADYSLNYY